MVAGRSQRCRASSVRNRGDQAPPKKANSTQAATADKQGFGLNQRIRELREDGRGQAPGGNPWPSASASRRRVSIETRGPSTLLTLRVAPSASTVSPSSGGRPSDPRM